MEGQEHAAGAASPVPRFDESSFSGADNMDRMKRYLRDIPVLHARVTNLVERLQREADELEALRTTLEAIVRGEGGRT